MAKPTILTVDDDPTVSQAITRDLRARYGADYRVVRATSGAQALDRARRAGAAGPPGRADRHRPADARHDRAPSCSSRPGSTPRTPSSSC